MKKNIYSLLVLSIITVLIINIFTKSEYLTKIIVFSINLFIKNIFPSLFPMFIISSLLIELELPKILGNIFRKPISKIFKTNENAAFVFFMSMLTGFPSSAKFINDLIDKNEINNKDAEKILMFTFFSNPLFIINTVGLLFYNSKIIGLKIFIAHLLGNIITGLIFRNYNKQIYVKKKKENQIQILINNINNKNMIEILLKSITSAIEMLLNIFGIITFILIIINILFKNPNSIIKIIIIGLIEMTTGLKYLSIYKISKTIKILTSVFFISFGGLSVHLQIMSILNKKRVKYLPFLVSRIIHAITSLIILTIIL